MPTLPARDGELLRIMDASFADAARRAGPHLVCQPGCSQCCHGAFPIHALDVLRLRAGVAALQASDPEAAAQLQARARAWLAEFASDFPGDASTGLLGESDEDQARFDDFANDAPCPALDPLTGLCQVYAYRPMTCRVFGPPVRVEPEDDSAPDDGVPAPPVSPQGAQLACCELCFTTATEDEIVACTMPLPHALEEELLGEVGDPGQTVVAFALLPPCGQNPFAGRAML